MKKKIMKITNMNTKNINLNNIDDLQKYSDIIIKFDFLKEAFLLLQKLNSIKNNFLADDKKYQDILIKLKWTALPKMKNKEIIDLFSLKFTGIFEIENYDVWIKLQNKIVNSIFYEERDDFKKEIKNALLKNQEIITSKKIIVSDKLVNPTVANWLKDYNINVGTNLVNKEKDAQYLTYSDNIKKIDNQDEKNKLKILFNLYQKLKFSSLTMDGIEEDIYIDDSDIKGVLSDGIFTKIDEKIENRIKSIRDIIDNKPSQKTGKFEITDEEREDYKHEKAGKLENEFSDEIEKKVIEEEVLGKVDRNHIVARKRELNALVGQYKKGSLERKAVEDELDKLAG